MKVMIVADGGENVGGQIMRQGQFYTMDAYELLKYFIVEMAKRDGLAFQVSEVPKE